MSFVSYDKVVLRDATTVGGRDGRGGTPWKELKHEAMGVHEAQKQKYLAKFGPIDKALVKSLIAAQKA